MTFIRTAALALTIAGLSLPVLAQEAPEEGRKQIWCGLAFTTAASQLPADASDADRAMAEQFTTAGEDLIQAGVDAYVTAGFTEEAAAQVRDELRPTVESEISANGGAEAEFSFEDCSVLLPQQ